MHKLFTCLTHLAFLATLTTYAAIAAAKSAKAGDVLPISNPHREAGNTSIEPEADGYTTSFPCLVSCIPSAAGYVDGAHMSIDLSDMRQLYILLAILSASWSCRRPRTVRIHCSRENHPVIVYPRPTQSRTRAPPVPVQPPSLKNRNVNRIAVPAFRNRHRIRL